MTDGSAHVARRGFHLPYSPTKAVLHVDANLMTLVTGRCIGRGRRLNQKNTSARTFRTFERVLRCYERRGLATCALPELEHVRSRRPHGRGVDNDDFVQLVLTCTFGRTLCRIMPEQGDIG